MIISFITLAGVLFLTFLLITVAYAGFLAAPWVPTRKKDVPRGVECAHIASHDRIADLGCGDGRILKYAVEKYGVEAHGYEVSIPNYFWSWIVGKFTNHFVSKGKMIVHYKNFFEENLSSFNVIFCFLSTKAMKRLEQKFENELLPGTKIISYAFRLPHWKSNSVSRPSKCDLPIYIYEVR